MLFLGVLLLSLVGWDYRSPVIPAVAVSGLALLGLGLGLWARKVAAGRSWTAFLVVEELLVIAGLGVSWPGAAVSFGTVAYFTAACLVTAVLALGIRIPDGAAPLNGIWLRRLLAVTALAGIAQFGPWAELLRQWQAAHLPVWPIALAVVVSGGLFFLAAEVLARRPVPTHSWRLKLATKG